MISIKITNRDTVKNWCEAGMANLLVGDIEWNDLGGNLRHGDGGTFSSALWRSLVDRFAVSSVLDIGCGEGHAVQYFARRYNTLPEWA
jgi:SAM-dependent methyltransferase